jgi:hypothetical protein
MEIKHIGLAGALALFSAFSHATVTTYDNLFDLFVNPGLKTTYDFEILTGFPTSSGTFTQIGMFDNIDFDATVYTTTQSISGTRSMTGSSGTSSAAEIDFSALSDDVVGVGFWALDLTRFGNEAIVLNVTYSDSSSQSYSITLNGAPRLTPVYFGLYSDDLSHTITSISLYGTDNSDRTRTWLIDDLTVVTVPAVIPVPAAAWLFASGLIGLVAVGRFNAA